MEISDSDRDSAHVVDPSVRTLQSLITSDQPELTRTNHLTCVV